MPDPRPVVVECAIPPPPEWLPVDLLDPPECAAGDVVGCLDLEAAILLRRQLLALRTWVDIAWARCGEPGEWTLDLEVTDARGH